MKRLLPLLILLCLPALGQAPTRVVSNIAPIRGIVQSEYASGANVGGAPLVLRAGSGTGGAPLTNKVSISIPIATNASSSGLQSAADVATFQVPTSPGTNQSIFKLYFWTGSAWAERGVWSTNIGGVNYLIHP